MRKTWTKRVISFLLLVVILISTCACDSETGSSKGSSGKHSSANNSSDKNNNKNENANAGKPDSNLSVFDKVEETATLTYSFSKSDTSEKLTYNGAQLQAFRNKLASCQVTYDYEKLFNCEKAMSGILVDHTVENHAYSALDANGKLTKEHLFEVVKQNTEAHLSGVTSIIKEVGDEILMRICEIIVDAVNATLERCPDIDKERVYCNLGNLKVVDKTSALDFAAVEPGMVLHINKNMFDMVNLMTSYNMYVVILHETMHIIQYGCTCEEIEGCTRRCGLAHAYNTTNATQDYSDWIWLAEGSAELLAGQYAKVKPETYPNAVNYIKTLNLATMLQDDVPANYVETLNFYCDPDLLFTLFGATTEAQKQEIYHMIYSLEMMQMEPEDVKNAYYQQYGVTWSNEIRDTLNNKVKRPIVQTLTKCFFDNLADAICSNNMTKNDFLFLLNVYESTINYHLNLYLEKYDGYNAEFVVWYATTRRALFDCLENVSEEDYEAYVASDGTDQIHAGMKWLDQDKQDFLIAKFEDTLCDYKFPVS